MMVWYGTVLYGMGCYGRVVYCMVWYGIVVYGMGLYGILLYGIVWCGTVVYGMGWSSDGQTMVWGSTEGDGMFVNKNACGGASASLPPVGDS